MKDRPQIRQVYRRITAYRGMLSKRLILVNMHLLIFQIVARAFYSVLVILYFSLPIMVCKWR